MHIELNIKDTGITYIHGDHLGIFPQNNAEEVAQLAQRLGITHKLNTSFTMTNIESNKNFII
jgi:NADPH-ferrihemoprotein reductase